MAQEFTINSSSIESKINQLLPSQGGFGAGVDFSASTMVIPIVDLTETAEGSNVRADLQTALSHKNVTSFSVNGATTTLVNTTGYFRVFGSATVLCGSASTQSVNFGINDGSTTKIVWELSIPTAVASNVMTSGNYDFIVFLEAGVSLQSSAGTNAEVTGCTRQIADIDGNLVNP